MEQSGPLNFVLPFPVLPLFRGTDFSLKVDCTSSSNTCSKYGVSGYPTLKVFRDGEESGGYDGPRTSGNCVVMPLRDVLNVVTVV